MDFYMELRRRNTKYFITKKKLLFQSWSWGKITVNTVDLSEFKRVTCNCQKDFSDDIHFMSNKEMDFKTYDFEGGGRHHYLTFENIPNALELSRLIEQYRKERVKERVLEVV